MSSLPLRYALPHYFRSFHCSISSHFFIFPSQIYSSRFPLIQLSWLPLMVLNFLCQLFVLWIVILYKGSYNSSYRHIYCSPLTSPTSISAITLSLPLKSVRLPNFSHSVALSSLMVPNLSSPYMTHNLSSFAVSAFSSLLQISSGNLATNVDRINLLGWV